MVIIKFLTEEGGVRPYQGRETHPTPFSRFVEGVIPLPNVFVHPIIQIFGYFHKSRLLYELLAFIDQQSWIKRVDKIMAKNIKIL